MRSRGVQWLCVAAVALVSVLVAGCFGSRVRVIHGEAQSTTVGTVKPLAALPPTPAGLDPSGRTIPVTVHEVPSNAVVMSTLGVDHNPGTEAEPVRSLNRAIELAPPGGTIVLRGGTYRDWYHNAEATSYGFVSKSLTFQAYPGETPWLDGSDVIDAAKWRPSGGLWVTDWSTPEFCDGKYYQSLANCAHADMSKDKANPMAKDPQMVFVDDNQLKQRSARTAVDEGSFFYDRRARRMYIGVEPTGRMIEVARRPVAMILRGDQAYVVRGVGFRKYATNELGNLTSGALRIAGSRSTVAHAVFERNAAQGLSYSNPAPGSVVRRSVFAFNGYTALGANGSSVAGGRNDFRIEENVFHHNNSERFGTGCTTSCGQAGVKLAHMVGATIAGNLVTDTQGRGHGLWCDLGCSDIEYVHNTLTGNGHAGIFHEVSDTGIIAGNVIRGSKYGILVASANTLVYNNTLVDNRQGINVYDDRRSNTTPVWSEIGPDTRDVEVVNNVVYGQNYSLIASPMRPRSPEPNTAADQLFAKVDYNYLHQSNGHRPVFVYWQQMNGKRTLFRSRVAFLSAKGMELHGRWLAGQTDPFFVNRAATDYRIRTGSPAYGNAGPIPTKVARALGVPQLEPDRSPGAFRE
jgi:hypothetical protein